MLTDSNPDIRRKAVEIVISVRSSSAKKPKSEVARGIRFFRPPTLNWNSTSYQDMIYWNDENLVVTEPPVLRKFDDEIRSALDSPMSLPDYPSHTTSVERCVKLVSDASKQVYGDDARHGLISSRIEAREKRASYDTKKDYDVKV